jgi:hypothetical protein
VKTDDLIKNLSENLPASQKRGFAQKLFIAWLLLTGAVVFMVFFLMPVRADLAVRSQSLFYCSETLIFFLTFLAAAYVAYRSVIPGLMTPRDQKWGLLFLIAATVFVAAHMSIASLSSEFLGEMNFYRGRCGPILFIIGALEGALCFALATRTAPTKPRLTAFWIAISAGTLALFFLQFICDHENFLHLLLWHLTPVFVLAGVSVIAGKKALRW